MHLYPHRFPGSIGHHTDNLPIEKLDISADGEIVASISHDQKVKFWNIAYLEQMDYDKTNKPFLNRKGLKTRKKANKMHNAMENEYQLPSSNRANKKDFFKDME